jgi:hypothetical protein
MSKGLISTTVVIFACPENLTYEVSELLGVDLVWHDQPLIKGSLKSQIHLKTSHQAAESLIANLNKLGSIHAEITAFSRDSGTIYLLAPGLGIYRADTNGAGEIMLSEERIRNIVDAAAGNFKELQRLLRLALGQAWDDLLEPFRAANYSDNVVLLNKAV